MKQIMQELKDLVLTANEEKVRRFISERWSDFPESVRTKLSAALFVDALRGNTRENKAFQEFKEELVQVLEEMQERLSLDR